MFSATVRFNLDPFDGHPDAELWTVLEQTQIKEDITNLPNKLQEMVTEGGQNFSLGQRQVNNLLSSLFLIILIRERFYALIVDTRGVTQTESVGLGRGHSIGGQ